MQGVARLPNSTLYVVEPGYLGLFHCLEPSPMLQRIETYRYGLYWFD